MNTTSNQANLGCNSAMVQTRRLILVVLLATPMSVLFLGCGGNARNESLRCDGGSELFFGYQELTDITQLSPGTAVAAENGVEFFFVDGACNYWVFSAQGQYSYWNDVMTGTLDEQQLAQFNADFVRHDWLAIENAPPALPSAERPSTFRIWKTDQLGECLAPCEKHPVSAFKDKAHRWIDRLYSSSSPLPDTNPMRWLVVEFGPPLGEPSEWKEWEGSSLSAAQVLYTGVPEKDELAVRGYGGRALVSKVDLPIVRALRADNRAGLNMATLHILQNGLGYWMNAREVLPFENELGLVRPPGWTASEL